MVRRRLVLVLLCVTVLAPMVLFTDRLATTSNSILNGGFVDDVSNLSFGNEIEKLNILPQASSVSVKEPIQTVHSNGSSNSDQISAYSKDGLALRTEELPSRSSREHNSRVLSATNEGKESKKERVIEQATNQESRSDGLEKPKPVAGNKGRGFRKTGEATPSRKQKNNHDKQSRQRSAVGHSGKRQMENHGGRTAMPDARVQHLKDQLTRANVYLDLESTQRSPPFIRELRTQIRDVQQALGDATMDSELPKNAYAILEAMEQTLAKGKQISDCSAAVKKLQAILRSTKEQLRLHNRQIMFLTQLAAKTIPKGLHCLPLRLSTEYHSLNAGELQFPFQEKLEDPALYHYALFSDNVLAAAVVVNSTVFNAKNPESHVFHIVTDRLNYAAMRMWFLANPPGKATIQVQSVEEFTWLNSSYSPVLKQLGSQSMIDYYFRTHHAKPDGTLKYRNPKYLSILNHLRFYLPEIFPKLNKVVFLDDDIVVQRDLTALWMIDLKGKVNGAVETCGESFHRFDKYLNFSNPIISKNFDPDACGWAYGMNIFDLAEWRKQNITEIYHFWQELNHDRLLWSLGTLPPGLITFYNRTFALDRSWHVLGLGYDPDVNQTDIERAAVIHYNGNMKPWLEIVMPQYRNYWSKYVDYDQPYLRACNVSP
ncbi:probable galacturonosyltransferase 4 [Phoenix dactylifera]|uniref:Hexosyltransferase n=1 Tax=Phoenix dactylifera TaxID=42345 RepID=A0A8B7BG14_PHODC|nr:probable galacturonosyltransferase 4 [Phoenix dactylifera]